MTEIHQFEEIAGSKKEQLYSVGWVIKTGYKTTTLVKRFWAVEIEKDWWSIRASHIHLG